MKKIQKPYNKWLLSIIATSLVLLLLAACTSPPISSPSENKPPAEPVEAPIESEKPLAEPVEATDFDKLNQPTTEPAQSPAEPVEVVDTPSSIADSPSSTELVEALPQSPAAFSGEVDGFRYEIRDLQVVQALDDKKVLGNVTNVGDQMFMFTRYTADFYDAAGNIVASAGPVRVSSDIHPVGSTLPIWFYVDDTIDWDHYEIYVSDRGAGTGGVQAQLLDLTVEPSGSRSEPCTTFTVTNNDDLIASWVFVIGRYYDDAGNLAGSWSTGLSKRFLEAGATSDVMPCVFENYPYDIQVIGYHQPNMHE